MMDSADLQAEWLEELLPAPCSAYQFFGTASYRPELSTSIHVTTGKPALTQTDSCRQGRSGHDGTQTWLEELLHAQKDRRYEDPSPRYEHIAGDDDVEPEADTPHPSKPRWQAPERGHQRQMTETTITSIDQPVWTADGTTASLNPALICIVIIINCILIFQITSRSGTVGS